MTAYTMINTIHPNRGGVLLVQTAISPVASPL